MRASELAFLTTLAVSIAGTAIGNPPHMHAACATPGSRQCLCHAHTCCPAASCRLLQRWAAWPRSRQCAAAAAWSSLRRRAGCVGCDAQMHAAAACVGSTLPLSTCPQSHADAVCAVARVLHNRAVVLLVRAALHARAVALLVLADRTQAPIGVPPLPPLDSQCCRVCWALQAFLLLCILAAWATRTVHTFKARSGGAAATHAAAVPGRVARQRTHAAWWHSHMPVLSCLQFSLWSLGAVPTSLGIFNTSYPFMSRSGLEVRCRVPCCCMPCCRGPATCNACTDVCIRPNCFALIPSGRDVQPLDGRAGGHCDLLRRKPAGLFPGRHDVSVAGSRQPAAGSAEYRRVRRQRTPENNCLDARPALCRFRARRIEGRDGGLCLGRQWRCPAGSVPQPPCPGLVQPQLVPCWCAGFITMRRPMPAGWKGEPEAAAEEPSSPTRKRGALEWAFVAAMVLAAGGTCVGAPSAGAVARGWVGGWGRQASGAACRPEPQSMRACAALGGIASLTVNCNTGSDPFLGVSLPATALLCCAVQRAARWRHDGLATCAVQDGPRSCGDTTSLYWFIWALQVGCAVAWRCGLPVLNKSPGEMAAGSRHDKLALLPPCSPAPPDCLPGPGDCCPRVQERA